MTDQPKLWRDMTDAEKGALLLAHHEGKEIQFWDELYCEVWSDCEPSWEEYSAYRVKPEPKVKTVVMTGYQYCDEWCFWEKKYPGNTHQITLTIIDGEVQREAIVERIEE